MHPTDEAGKLALLRGLPLPAINAALADGVLSFGEHRRASAWFIRDECAGSARRLDGKLWRLGQEHPKALDTPGTSGLRANGWPIGIRCAKERQAVIVCEGGPDMLAAYAIREELRGDFGIVCLLGSGLTIHESARHFFDGKRVRFLAHNDDAGSDLAERNAAFLSATAGDVTIASVNGMSAASGTVANDLCDALAHRHPFRVPAEIAAIFDFERPCQAVRTVALPHELFTPAELVTQDHPRGHKRTQEGEGEREGKEKEEKEKQKLYAKARALACTARHQSHAQLFKLAREVRGWETRHGGESKETRSAAFEIWFATSKPHLDPSETRTEYLARFRASLRKVRIPAGEGGDTLPKAIERARCGALPDIPDAPDAPAAWRLLAAVCRELQCVTGDAPFFLSSRAATSIVGGDHPMHGHRALESLCDLGVLLPIRRGDAWPGGKANEYRYLLS